MTEHALSDLGQIAALGESNELIPLPDWVCAISASMEIDELVSTVVDRDVAIAFPELRADKDFVEQLEASVRENLQYLQGVLSGRLPVDQVKLRQPVSFATFQAQAHLPQTTLQRSYRVGFFTFWQAWARAIRSKVEENDIPRDEAMLALTRVTQVLQSYQDHVGTQVADVYATAEANLRQSSAHLRQRLLSDLVSGAFDTPTASDLVTIGYQFSAWHIALYFPSVSEPQLERLLQRLRSALPVRESVTYAVSSASSVAWVSRIKPWDVDAIAALYSGVRDLGIAVSIGEPAYGLDGFRSTFEQTRQVEKVRSGFDQDRMAAVLGFDEVALDILLLQDPVLARAFVQRELRSLAGVEQENVRIRETLEASFSMGSHIAAAAKLGVHEHTVRNRLRRVEEILGHPVTERRTEIQVALRLTRLLVPEDRPQTSERLAT